MTILICISDLTHRREYLHIDNNNNLTTLPGKPHQNDTETPVICSNAQSSTLVSRKRPFKRLRLEIEGISGYYLLREIQKFSQFRRLMCANPALRGLDVLWIQLLPPAKDVIDYRWNGMLSHSLWEKIEVEYLMSWLSTLGGGYSALGEQFSECAKTAGKISLKQLSIGLRLGDPFLQARCRLYYSISLIQMGRLRHAKHIVREQYKFAIEQKEIDGRLVNMCIGIWMRLQYEYARRHREREKLKLLGAGDK